MTLPKMVMKKHKHKIVVEKTAHYYSLGNISTAKTLWFVLHGYGYNANYFIHKFDEIADEENFVVAPEGLSNFYVSGVSGRVGASWMTKENREDEIQDYLNYLNSLYETLLSQIDLTEVRVNVIGFSQGGATAARWISDNKINCANLILWASVFPDDMKFEVLKTNTNSFLLYGDDDEYVTQERIDKQKAILEKANINCKLIEFKGKHDVPAEVLQEQRKLNNW
jgi:predicted esterase